jgi:hypothetical protein
MDAVAPAVMVIHYLSQQCGSALVWAAAGCNTSIDASVQECNLG